MSLFKKKHNDIPRISLEECVPVLRCSICTGEQVAGFRDKETGRFEEVMLLRTPRDLEVFRSVYGITGEIENLFFLELDDLQGGKLIEHPYRSLMHI